MKASSFTSRVSLSTTDNMCNVCFRRCPSDGAVAIVRQSRASFFCFLSDDLPGPRKSGRIGMLHKRGNCVGSNWQLPKSGGGRGSSGSARSRRARDLGGEIGAISTRESRNRRERLLRRQNRLGSDRISFGVSGSPCHAVHERDRDTFLKARVCLQFHAHLTRGLFLWFGPFSFFLSHLKCVRISRSTLNC